MARILFQPQTREALRAGIDTLAAAVTPTLGPLTGTVALDDATRGGSPELLDDGGAIARRILQLDDPDADIGAMLLREALWQQREQFGDGYGDRGRAVSKRIRLKGIASSARAAIACCCADASQKGMKLMLETLRQQVRAITESHEVERLAQSICGEPQIAATLADIFDVLGPHNPIEVRDGGRDLHHEFFLGSHWESKVPSNIVFEGRAGDRIELRNTAWLISDFELG